MNQQNNQNNQNNDGSGGKKNRQSLLIVMLGILGALMIWSFIANMSSSAQKDEEITYSEFLQMLDKDEVKSVQLQSTTLTITPREQKYKNITVRLTQRPLWRPAQPSVERLSKIDNIEFKEIEPDSTGMIASSILSFLIPFVLLIVGMNLIMGRMSKGGGMMGNMGKSKAKAYVQKETGVLFSDVAGQDEAKESLQEVVDFLHNPAKYTSIGAKLPKGALLGRPARNR